MVLAAMIGFRENLFRWWMDPRTPFQTTQPPSEPDYALDENWAYRGGEIEDGEAAVFFVHPTTYWGGESWNAAIDHPEARVRLDYAYMPSHAGPYFIAGPVWAPRYRQASLFTALTHRYDAQQARTLASEDIERAFEEFLSEIPEDAPIILAGVEQGALHVLRVLMNRAAEDDVQMRIVAAYLNDFAVPVDALRMIPDLPLCSSADETRCIVAWASAHEDESDEISRLRDRTMVWNEEGRLEPTQGRALACVNPLLGAATEDFVPRRQNQGAVNASGLNDGAEPAPVSAQTSAQCRDGVLLIEEPNAPSLREGWSWGGRFKPRATNLFYADIRADIERRLAAAEAARIAAAEAENATDEPAAAPPIDETVVIEDAPIMPVPESED